MRLSKMITVSLGAIALGLGQNVLAEESEDASSSDKPSITEEMTSLSELIQGLKDNDDTTVEENGGEIEAALLSAGAISSAAQKICDDIGAQSPGTTEFLMLTDQDRKDVQKGAAYEAQIRIVTEALRASIEGGQAGGPAVAGGDGSRGFLTTFGTVLQLISAISASDDTVSKIEGTINDVEVLKDAVGACLVKGQKTVRQPRSILPRSDDAGLVFQPLAEATEAYSNVIAIPQDKRSDAQKAAIGAYENLLKKLGDAANDGALFEQIVRARTWSDSLGDTAPGGAVAVIDLSIAKSGGTLLKRKNLGTALGFKSLAVTAGLIVNYKLSSPANGAIAASGIVYCTTTQRSFGAIHKLDDTSKVANCKSTLPKN
ncbi:hypothetical protein [Parerythrobacter aestuarii]|uniref:hypothetical protein n=1 Tax=Parerythrobacter aestuarii TaxID=3020909 RepID=UPI0024DE3C71|nr:hypothetical protein [Parerythrobacter aestuarii]